MTITHLVDSLEIGGAERLVVSLCRLHRAAGQLVDVHCLFRGGPLAIQLEREGFSVQVHQACSLYKLVASLHRSFRRQLPDVVHCHNATATVAGALAARLAGAGAVISTRHGLAVSDHSWWGEFKFRLVARFCDRIVAVCDAAHQNLARRLGRCSQKILTVRNGAARPSIPAGERIPKRGFTLIHVARLMWKKDQATLLRAFRLARQRVGDLHLWIAGDGPDRPSLESLSGELGISEQVSFLGECQDIGRWLTSADVFVLSSESEGTPLALLEAMAAGLPFVATNVGGVPEIARLSGVGSIVPPRRPDALAEAIVALAHRRHELSPLGVQARRCYDRYFTCERMAQDYLQLYRACLSGREGAIEASGSGQAKRAMREV